MTYPETEPGGSYSGMCSEGFSGYITRVCTEEGVWQAPLNTCSGVWWRWLRRSENHVSCDRRDHQRRRVPPPHEQYGPIVAGLSQWSQRHGSGGVRRGLHLERGVGGLQ